MSRALILDLDGSVMPLPGAEVMTLREREEELRFACHKRVLKRLSLELRPVLACRPPVIFLGSGDFHHLTFPLIEELETLHRPIQVVVFDNHPDNMLYPFGVHCGSWVWHVSRLPFVSRVHVAGITSSDVERGHVWENHLPALRSGKVVYWCIQRELGGLRRAGVRQSSSFSSVTEMLAALTASVSSSDDPVYLSIDKDVLAFDVVQTNWDQGVMQLEELESALDALLPRLIGSDIVGDVSAYRYRSWFKRLLSGADGQRAIPLDQLASWQERHRQVNLRLLDLLSRSAGRR